MSLIVEDGTGLTDANSYVTVATANGYFADRLYAESWDGASDSTKGKALVTASRMIDANFIFNGFQKNNRQGLQWPRLQAVNPDQDNLLPPGSGSMVLGFLGIFAQFYDENKVPMPVAVATCELALAMIQKNRIVDPPGEGIKKFAIKDGISVEFDQTTIQPLIPLLAQNILSKVGIFNNRNGGTAKLVRG